MTAENEVADARLALLAVLQRIVDQPERVEVTSVEDEGGSDCFLATVAPSDLAKAIGKGGRTVRAMQTILNALDRGTPEPRRLRIEGGAS